MIRYFERCYGRIVDNKIVDKIKTGKLKKYGVRTNKYNEEVLCDYNAATAWDWVKTAKFDGKMYINFDYPNSCISSNQITGNCEIVIGRWCEKIDYLIYLRKEMEYEKKIGYNIDKQKYKRLCERIEKERNKN